MYIHRAPVNAIPTVTSYLVEEGAFQPPVDLGRCIQQLFDVTEQHLDWEVK